MKYTVIIVLIFLITGCSNQIILNTPDQSMAVGNHILQTKDGGLIIAGQDKKSSYHSRGWINEGSGVLLKLDRKKQKIWKKQYPFLKFSATHDIIETSDQELIFINPLKHNQIGGRGIDTLSYLTKINKSGSIVYQKIISGTLMKVVEKDQNNILLLGFKNQPYEKSINLFANQPFITCVDARGNIKWTETIDDIVNWVDEMYLKKDTLYINSTFIKSSSKNVDPHWAVRKIYQFDLKQKKLHVNTKVIPENSLYLSKENSTVELVKNENWILKIEDDFTGKTSLLELGIDPELHLLSRLRLGYMPICTQLGESYKGVNQITSNLQGDIFMSILIVNTLDKKNDVSLSTQAYCHKNIDGFLVVKIDKSHHLKWIKHFKKKAIPLNIKSIDDDEIAIVGTLYKENGIKVEALEEKLYYFLMDKNGQLKTY